MRTISSVKRDLVPSEIVDTLEDVDLRAKTGVRDSVSSGQ